MYNNQGGFLPIHLSWRMRFLTWEKENRIALIVVALLFLAHLASIYELRFNYNLDSDDMAYVRAGLVFAKTGMITCHEDVPSAQILPGMPVLMSIFYILFGEGKLFWIAVKAVWAVMGIFSAWFTYKIVCIFAPKWAGIIAMIPYFRPDILWMDNTVLTETPFILCLTCMVYYTLMMGKYGKYRYFWGCAAAYMCGLMLKANIALYPLLALVYLLIVRYDKKKLMKQIVILTCIVLCFEVPWTIRNYNQFHAFIPLTYGAGNPALLGTYQGMGYPDDSELDYETNVTEVLREKYAEFYNEDGSLPLEYSRYVSLQRDSIKANYRLSVWKQNDFSSLIYSYAVLKPQAMVNSYFYWDTLFGVDKEQIKDVQMFDLYLCLAAVALSLVLKKQRLPVLFLTGVYLFNIYIYSMTYAFSRYNASLMSLRFALVGFSVYLILCGAAKAIDGIREEQKVDHNN